MMYRSFYSLRKTSSQINYSEEGKVVLEKQEEERRRGEGVRSARAFSILKLVFSKHTLQKTTRQTNIFKENILNGFRFCANNNQRCYFRKGWYLFWRQRKMALEVNFNKNKSFKNGLSGEQADRTHSMAAIGQEPERKQLLSHIPYGKLYCHRDRSDPTVTNVITKGQGGVPKIWNYICSNPAARTQTRKLMWMPQRPSKV